MKQLRINFDGKEMEDDKQYFLALHIKTRTTGFQLNKPCIVLTYYEDHGGLSRALKTRSIDYPFAAVRRCTKEEMECESNPYRFCFLQYISWQLLIDDEKKWTTDKEWFKTIENLQKSYPQFNP